MAINEDCDVSVGRAPTTDYIHSMAEIVNLRRTRKAKARAAAEDKAKANRVAHGLSKANRRRAKFESDASERKLDGHKRDDT